MKRVLAAFMLVAALGAAETSLKARTTDAGRTLDAGRTQPGPAQDEFVPVSDVEAEQLPAAPLVMTAYAVAWVVIFLYLWSIWRRLGRVEREIDELTRRTRAQTRAT
jgi:CcmD family protein